MTGGAGEDMTGGAGEDMTGGAGEDMTGGAGEDMTGGAGEDMTGGAGEDMTGGAGEDMTGGAGEDMTGGAGEDMTGGAGEDMTGGAGEDMTGALPSARLAALGLALPPVVAPVGAYVPAVLSGDLVFTSGQLPVAGGELGAVGKVGAQVSPERAKELARVCALNALAAVDALVGLDRVAQVVKVVGFVASTPDFTGQPAVVNGASELFGEVFGDAGRHARSAVGVAALPLDAPVEVEVVVRVTAPPGR